MVELLLVTGAISFITLGGFWANQKRLEKAKLADQEQAVVMAMQGLNALLKNYPDQGGLASQINPILSNTAALRRMQLFPDEMFLNSRLQHKWHGPIQLSGQYLPAYNTAVYEIALHRLPQQACAHLATSPRIFEEAARIVVNGVAVKNPGTGLSASQVATACSRDQNLLAIQGSFESFAEKPKSTGSPAYSRDPEGKYNIASHAADTKIALASPPTCSGNSTWNATYQFCHCPEGSQWNGRTCIPFGTPGMCPPGQSWSLELEACEALPGGVPYQYIEGVYVPQSLPKEVLFSEHKMIQEYNEAIIKSETPKADRWAIAGVDEVSKQSECAIIPKNPSDGVWHHAGPGGIINTYWNHPFHRQQKKILEALPGGRIYLLPKDVPLERGFQAEGMNSQKDSPNNAKMFWDGKICVVCAHGKLDGDRCVTH